MGSSAQSLNKSSIAASAFGPSASSSSTARSFLARTLQRRGTTDNVVDEPPSNKGPLGLSTLYEPPDELGAPIADIVFVHGLNGGSQSTWSKGNLPALFWPKEWLPNDPGFVDVRIHSFGYPAGLGRESILGVHDFARSLLAAVKDSPRMMTTRGAADSKAKTPLVFVAHSMGGLVVKKAYAMGHRDPEFQPVVDRVCAIVFLATPHLGATLAQTLARLVALTPGSGARPFVDDLVPQSGTLQAINDDFPRVCHRLQLMSFYETRPMSIGGVIGRALVVDKTSAVMNLPNERRTLLDADHRAVAMFASTSDSAYVAVRNALATVVGAHRESSRLQGRRAAQDEQAALGRFLGVSAAPEDDIMSLDSGRLQGSCEWLASKKYYRSWREALDCRFLWLRGRPGTGKSVLAGHIVNSLREEGRDCCFFFFRGGDKTKATANACLRSLAWQMACIHPDIFAKLQELLLEAKDDEPADRKDANVVWRKVFLSGILKVRLNRNQFWVVDAMDECRGGNTEMMSFLARIQEQWPVSVLVTSRDGAQSHLLGSNASQRVDIRCEAISPDDSKQDISLFMRLNMSLLPCPSSSRYRTPGDIAASIIERSGGCFLWASLICSELREVSTEKEIDSVLDSVPADMDSLYSKILDDMSLQRFGRDLARSILTMATYSFRALTTDEIREPIEIDIDDKVADIERAISKCCGHLVHADSNGKVQLVHATAREFLTRKGREGQSEFVVGRAEGHRRLAMVCLQHLIRAEPQKQQQKTRRLGSDPDVPTSSSSFPSANKTFSARVSFSQYASTYVFQHLVLVHSNDEGVFSALAKFFACPAVLRWIEFVASTGDLQPVYQAGKTVNTLLARRAQHSPPLGFSRSKQLVMLEKWGDDLVHIATKFSSRLRLAPHSIHHLIPAFCPSGSAIRQQFTNIYRGIVVHGLSTQQGWDDCLTTVTYNKGTKPNAIATGPGLVAIGMMNGSVIIYDDSVLQEVQTLHHGEPVWKMAFAEGRSGGGGGGGSQRQLLATAGGKSVRIWDVAGEVVELASFSITSVCTALAFYEEDEVLRAATRQNLFYEWDLEAGDFVRDEPASWAADLEEEYRGRTPVLVALGRASPLVAIGYRGQDMVLWDHEEQRVHDIYEQEVGSKMHAPAPRPPGFTNAHTVRAVAFGGTPAAAAASIGFGEGGERLAAIYQDGTLVVYDTASGLPTAVQQGAATSVLAASPDGRTLAGADSAGNLTLFDLETLRPLCRIRFDTALIPKALAFSADGRRFIEVRGQQCRVWEPTALLRQDYTGGADVYEDEQLSDTISVSTSPQEIAFLPPRNEFLAITALTSCAAPPAIFCALSDGSVRVHDLSGGAGADPTVHHLFIQTSGCAIGRISLGDGRPSGTPGLLLACGDLSGRVTLRRVVSSGAGGKGQSSQSSREASWSAEEPLVDVQSLGQGLLKGEPSQLIVSSRDGRLLAVTDEEAVLWPASVVQSPDGTGWLARLQGRGGHHWLADPSRPDVLWFASPVEFEMYSWDSLTLLGSVQYGCTGTIRKTIPLDQPRIFATISSSHQAVANSKDVKSLSPSTPTNCPSGSSFIQLWDLAEFEASAPGAMPAPQQTVLLAREIDSGSSAIERVIGAFGARLVVLTTDRWIASLELAEAGNGASAEGLGPGIIGDRPPPPPPLLLRHFFIPDDWIGGAARNFVAGLGRAGGEILFARQAELAVIRRGLEVLESGGSFNPRRGSSNSINKNSSNQGDRRKQSAESLGGSLRASSPAFRPRAPSSSPAQ